MKNSFEWKKDIKSKVATKRAAIAKRNTQLRAFSGVSLAAAFCACCGVAVVRFSNINQPPVSGTSDSVMTIPSFPDHPVAPDTTGHNGTTVPNDTAGVMTIPSYTEGPAFTAAGDTPTGEITEYDPRNTEDQISHPIYTGVDPYPTTTSDIITSEYPSTGDLPISDAFRVIREIDKVVNGSPLYVPADRMVKYRKTFSEALRYYGLSEFAIPNMLTDSSSFKIDEFEYVEFISMKDENGMGELPVSDDITVRYSAANDITFYELSMGMIKPPYDCVYVYDENSTFNYREVKVTCGYLNSTGATAELIVADFEYNGVIFRFKGHYSTEKTFIKFLYNIIDGLFTR